MPEIAETLDDESLLEDVLTNFSALVNDSAWIARLIDSMGIGRLQFLLRKQMRVEIQGLRIALWRLALARSFPSHADELFQEFLFRFTRDYPDKLSKESATRAPQYWGMLQPGGDSDFNSLARHLASFLAIDNASESKAMILKLALAIRADYKYIFDRLI